MICSWILSERNLNVRECVYVCLLVLPGAESILGSRLIDLTMRLTRDFQAQQPADHCLLCRGQKSCAHGSRDESDARATRNDHRFAGPT
ncbi:hypothetical protein PHLGIDRAFT_458572 [Phlebiopsis gigantea 11061_1 CR5-6]|uniref:Uncharacterized protein n=1 Tax=Phlebiopsis gigantea (strain 11061_1 CR5-6) TaxID=745531 RepID=A0A0C3SF85_PHLG1|nr:hypothetical protein PHLGIDRAFT_458572 [Phlebiopsis gigantea 11061_1 CR5-6]